MEMKCEYCEGDMLEAKETGIYKCDMCEMVIDFKIDEAL